MLVFPFVRICDWIIIPGCHYSYIPRTEIIIFQSLKTVHVCMHLEAKVHLFKEKKKKKKKKRCCSFGPFDDLVIGQNAYM